MKKSFLFIFIILATSIIFSCKKKSNCGCNSKESTLLPPTGGELSYDERNNKWTLSTMPNRGYFEYYYPCNFNQDSLKAILQGANQNQTFLVLFSGNVSAPCSNESFVPSPYAISTKFNYITIDSLRRF